MKLILAWLPLAAAITILSGLVYGTVQQSYRQNANDPQIQMAEDTWSRLDLQPHVDPATLLPAGSGMASVGSLAPFVSVYDQNRKLIISNRFSGGPLDADPPSGVFDAADADKVNHQNRVTWQPEPHTRIALVVEAPHGGGSIGNYVVVGRSLREVEKRENQLGLEVLIAWLASLIFSLFLAFVGPKVKGVNTKQPLSSNTHLE